MQTFGISTALLTPFAETGEIDAARLCTHAASVLENGADSITLFGTTGEGASIGMDERASGIEALFAKGGTCRSDYPWDCRQFDLGCGQTSG